MGASDHVSDEQARKFHDLINERKEILVAGIEGMHLLKKAIAYAVRQAGLKIEWDPSTPAAFRERLGMMSLSALQWSIPGAAAGLAVGAFTNRPAMWIGIGVGLAVLLGVYQGHCAVTSGWRIRGYIGEDGVEYVEVKVRALPSPTAR